MAYNFHFDPVDLPQEAKELRQEVRAFLREEIAAGTFSPHASSHGGRNDNARAFARKVGGARLDRHDLAEAIWRP